MQKNLKLTSVRLDPDMLEKVEKFQKSHHYWTKNGIINSVLVAVFQDFDERDIYDMIRLNRLIKTPVLATYRIVKNPELPNDIKQKIRDAEDI